MRSRRSEGLALFLSGLAALSCGGPDAAVVHRPEVTPVEVAAGTHVVLRRGHDVSGYCAATKGELTAFVVIEPSGAALYTSTSPALEEASFVAGPPLDAFGTSSQCQLVPTDDGFAVAWVGATPDGASVLVQRLSNDGTPLGEPLAIAAAMSDRFAFVADGERLFVGRVVNAELFVDTVESERVESELIASCATPSLPVLLPNGAAVDAFYVCSGDEQAELTLSRVVDGERESSLLASAETSFGEPALSAVDSGDRWSVIWSTTAALEFPPLLEIDKQSLEVSERAVGEPRAAVPWELALVERKGKLLLRSNVCREQSDEAGAIPCGVELCALGLESSEGAVCSLLDVDNSAELLTRPAGLALSFLEFGADAGGDLFSVRLDDALALAAVPEPVLGPGRLDPLRMDCAGAACTVFGREGASALPTPLAPDRTFAARYGFWTTPDAESADAEVDEAVVLEVSYDVARTQIWGFDWSVGAVWWEGDSETFGILQAGGVVLRHAELGSRDPVALFHEDAEGISRYRLFDYDSFEPGLYLTTLDAEAAAPAVRVAAEELELVGRCGERYAGIDAERRLHRFDPLIDDEFVPGEKLPVLPAADGELVRCLGERIAGVSYGATETRLYREESDGKFREWRFAEPAQNQAPALTAFRAESTELHDGRLAFIVQPGTGFGVPLVALLLGASGEPEAVALELPEGVALTAAAAPERQAPGTLVLAFSEAATRATLISTFRLP